jgi:hypothetical protein
MTTRPEPDEILSAWLDEGPTRLPDQTRRAIAVALPMTTQRRRAWSAPWRFPSMSTMPKVVLGAVAAIAIVLGGAYLLRPGETGVGVGPAPTASPSPTLTASPTPALTPTPSATPIPTPGPIGSGTTQLPLLPGPHVVGDPFAVHFTMTVPDGWSGNVGGPNAVWLIQTLGPGAIDMTIVDDVYANPCNFDAGYVTPRPGTSVDALVAALGKLPSVSASKATDATLAGKPAKLITLNAPTTCSPDNDGQFPLWHLPLGATDGLTPGNQDRVWVMEVGGKRVVIAAQEPAVRDAALHAQIQSILDSIKFS